MSPPMSERMHFVSTSIEFDINIDINLSLESLLFWVRDVDMSTSIVVGLPVLTTCIITFRVGFGLEPSRILDTELTGELENIKMKLGQLTQMVEEISKAPGGLLNYMSQLSQPLFLTSLIFPFY